MNSVQSFSQKRQNQLENRKHSQFGHEDGTSCFVAKPRQTQTKNLAGHSVYVTQSLSRECQIHT